MASNAFNEFVYKRCEEILSKDQKANAANDNIYKQIVRLKGLLNPEALELFNDIQSQLSVSEAYNQFIIYKQAFADRIELK